MYNLCNGNLKVIQRCVYLFTVTPKKATLKAFQRSVSKILFLMKLNIKIFTQPICATYILEGQYTLLSGACCKKIYI